MRRALNFEFGYKSRNYNGENSDYLCPYCGGDIFSGERIYAADGSQFICEECFCDYLNDMTVDEFCRTFNIDSKEAAEAY